MKNIVLEIGDFIGFCDLNGTDAMQTEQVEKLEEYIHLCNQKMNEGEPLVADAIYDRLMEILRAVNPDSDLCKYIWEDSVEEFEDTDEIVQRNPMYSIQTVKSLNCDELNAFISRLPDGVEFDAHVSVKLNGHGIRLKYKNGQFFQARSRARSSAGRDITRQLDCILGDLRDVPDLYDIPLCEIRGEWVLPFDNLDTARQYNPDIKSAFSAVASMGRDSATEDEWKLLHFVAYEFLCPDVFFTSKSDEYDFLEELGFTTPLSWVIEGLTKENLVYDLEQSIIPDCESDVKPDSQGYNGYEYYTDGIVFSINDSELFKSLGDDGGHYKYGNMALKVGYWEQNILSGYVQAILWTKGKSKLSPVAIVAEVPDIIQFKDYTYTESYFFNKNEVENWDELGVVAQSGNKVRRIPLYEPNNLAILDAYPGHILNFRYGGEAGVVPCFEDGTPLLDGRVQELVSEEADYSLDWVD